MAAHGLRGAGLRRPRIRQNRWGARWGARWGIRCRSGWRRRRLGRHRRTRRGRRCLGLWRRRRHRLFRRMGGGLLLRRFWRRRDGRRRRVLDLGHQRRHAVHNVHGVDVRTHGNKPQLHASEPDGGGKHRHMQGRGRHGAEYPKPTHPAAPSRRAARRHAAPGAGPSSLHQFQSGIKRSIFICCTPLRHAPRKSCPFAATRVQLPQPPRAP
jgi:hypothetical protein